MTTPDTTMDDIVEVGDLADALAWVRLTAAIRPRNPIFAGVRLSTIDGFPRVEAHEGTRQARSADVPATCTTSDKERDSHPQRCCQELTKGAHRRNSLLRGIKLLSCLVPAIGVLQPER